MLVRSGTLQLAMAFTMPRRSRSPQFASVLALLMGAGVAIGSAWCTRGVTAFVVGGVSQLGCSRVPLRAEGTSASESEKKEKAPLVRLTDENVQNTASLLGGVVGLLVGGIWVGAALFAATTYFSRRPEDDISKAINGVARTGLEAINGAGDLNAEYQVTDQVGSSLSGAVQSAKENPSTKDAAEAVTGAIDTAVDSFTKFEKEVDVKGSASNLLNSVTSVTYDAVDKVAELDKEYKVTDAVGKKLDEVNKELKITDQIGKITDQVSSTVKGDESKPETKPK